MNEPTTSDQGVKNIEARDIESKAKPEEDIKLPVDIVKKLILRGTTFDIYRQLISVNKKHQNFLKYMLLKFLQVSIPFKT